MAARVQLSISSGPELADKVREHSCEARGGKCICMPRGFYANSIHSPYKSCQHFKNPTTHASVGKGPAYEIIRLPPELWTIILLQCYEMNLDHHGDNTNGNIDLLNALRPNETLYQEALKMYWQRSKHVCVLSPKNLEHMLRVSDKAFVFKNLQILRLQTEEEELSSFEYWPTYKDFSHPNFYTLFPRSQLQLARMAPHLRELRMCFPAWDSPYRSTVLRTCFGAFPRLQSLVIHSQSFGNPEPCHLPSQLGRRLARDEILFERGEDVCSAPSVNYKCVLSRWINLTPWVDRPGILSRDSEGFCGCYWEDGGYTIRWDAENGKALSEYGEFWNDINGTELLQDRVHETESMDQIDR